MLHASQLATATWPADPPLLAVLVSSPACLSTGCHCSDMNINSWIFAAGLAALFWSLPVESSPDLDTPQVMRQVQLALRQFQTFKEAKTFQDISFSVRVNRKYLLLLHTTDIALLTISDHPSCLLDQFHCDWNMTLQVGDFLLVGLYYYSYNIKIASKCLIAKSYL